MLNYKKKARLLEKQIELFTNYLNSEISLENILENISSFLDLQRRPQSMDIDGITTPEKLLLDNDYTKDVKRTIGVLNHYMREAKDSIKGMQFQLDSIYMEIDNLYCQMKLQKNKYKLHSLLIHDGYAGSGHYYTFVHDIESDKWRKYSDLIISDVSVEDVMKDAIGGNGLSSAYCLFYVREDLIKKSSNRFWDFELNAINNSIYMQNIPGHILADITADNKKLEEEIKAFQSS